MIKTDPLSLKLYAQDASMYQEQPKGVAVPQHPDDIRELVRKAYKEGFSITPRAAGTSLAGQATGDGVVLDISRHLNRILQIDAESRSAWLEPGVIRDSLNREAAGSGLFFGPDTSTTNRCMIGGMIGNNSSGSFSVRYQTTREHVKEMEVILSNGDIAHFKPLSGPELDAKLREHSLEGHIYRSMIRLLSRNKELIQRNYPHPDIIRRNTGYALDKLCEMKPVTPNGRPFNMCELLCGSEGTLAVTTKAKLNLEELPANQQLIIPQFENLQEAMKATIEAVKLEPSAVELVDDVILNATKGNLEHVQNRFFLEGEPKCILIIQFDGASTEELHEKCRRLKEVLSGSNLGYAYPVLDNTDEIARVWELRKAGLGLLMGLGKDSRSPTFCEDTAVRVQDLPAYVADFEKLLEKYETSCVFYAHASVGELHLRPMIDTTRPEGIDKMKRMAEEIAELVGRYKGSLSGEHGDGRARAPYIEKVLGKEMIPVLQQVKEIWDPHYLLNPGKIVRPKPMESDLRFSPDYDPLKELDTVFQWRREGSLTNAAELCNGAGVCRKLAESGGTMCPSYMATKEEKDSTRGRANVFRQVFSGEDPAAFASKELKEALDLCLSCKACKSECPANVDMAKMKAEFMQGWHDGNRLSLRTRFFGKPAGLYSLGARFPGMSNGFMRSAFGRFLLDKIMGISKERDLPAFAEQTFGEWFRHRKSVTSSDKKVVLFVDLFTNYHEPEIGIASVKILEHLGYEVMLPKVMESGRPQISKGLLKDAKQIASGVIGELKEFAQQDIPIVGLEPSEILSLRDEYPDLVDDELLADSQRVAEKVFMLEELLAQHTEAFSSNGESEKVLFHGHCHAKALIGNQAVLEVLKKAGYEVELLDAGCCGMAGSFGYEKEHYELSMQIGAQRLFPAILQKEHHLIGASGFSCRHQINDGCARRAYHPAELIAQRLNL